MAIRIQAPDGGIAEFPDGMPESEIIAAMAAAYPPPDLSRQGAADAAALRMQRSIRRPEGRDIGELAGAAGAAVDPLMRQAADGATFGLADKFAAGMRSATGDAPDYETALQQERGRTDQFQQEHPVMAGGAQMVGGLGTGAGLIKGGVTLSNAVRNSPLWLKAAGLGAEGAAYGAAQKAGHVDNGSLGDYGTALREGGQQGFALGAGLPVAGRLAGSVYEHAAPFFSRGIDSQIPRRASSLLELGATADREGLRQLSQLGPEAMIADAGPFFTGLAQGTVAKPGPQQAALARALEARNAGRNTRLADDITDNLGPAESPVGKTKELLDARTAITSPMYKKAFEEAPPVDPFQVLRVIEGRLQNAAGGEKQALIKARDMIVSFDEAGKPLIKTDAKTLHNIKGELDNLIEYGDAGLGVPPGAFKREQSAIKEVRRALNGTLEDGVPGYREANAKSSEYAKYVENVETGTSLLDGGKTAVWPQDLNRQIAASTPEQVAALRSGVRADIENKVGTQANDLAALKKSIGGDRDWNRDKLTALYGEDPVKNVIGAVDREQRFANTHSDVLRNSQTAPRLGASKLIDGEEPKNIPLDTTIPGLVLRGGQATARALGRALMSTRAEGAREGLASVLPKTGPERDLLVQLLLDKADKRGARRAAIEGTISSPALANALLSYGR